MFPNDHIPPLETETEYIVSREEEGEEVNSALVVIKVTLGVEVMDQTEEFKKLMKSYFDDTTKNTMKGLELMSIQLGGKMAAWGINSSHHEEKKNYGVLDF